MCLDNLLYPFHLFLTNQYQIPKPCVEMMAISLALHAEIPHVRAFFLMQDGNTVYYWCEKWKECSFNLQTIHL
jgi:hypothetical protein